jgi:hypothetical protein
MMISAMSGLEQAIPDATRTDVGGLTVDEMQAGEARIKRVIYPPGWRWSTHMAPVTGTSSCQHAHVGFLAQGVMEMSYADGCTSRYEAPAFVVVEPGHDGWVVGDETAVFIQVDHRSHTAERLGMAGEHRH